MNDIDPPARATFVAHPQGSSDPQGQAALLLVESLIHGLIRKASLTSAEAIEIIEVAAEVKTEMADHGIERPVVAAASLSLLNGMADSLRRDLDG